MNFNFTRQIQRAANARVDNRGSVGFLCWVVILCLLGPDVSAQQPVPSLQRGEINTVIKEIASAQNTDEREIKALLLEFDAMRRTDGNQAAEFVATVATPQKVDRLFRTPAVTLLPTILRENGLIFAGQEGSNLLTFDKPSDVIAKVQSWFPDELLAARAKNDLRPSDIQLFGPYGNWALEPSTFLAMWNCMPKEAWLQPQDTPFRSESGGNLFTQMASLGGNETDFGACVRARNGISGAFTYRDLDEVATEIRTIAERVVPNLRKKFATFLKADRCSGKGPDDCVLVLHLWASLDAHDPELAVMLKSLEPEIALNSPPPAMKKPFEWSNSKRQDGEDRFNEVWKRAAFLRAKLSSLLANANAWPNDALGQTIRQLMRLQVVLQEPFAHRFYYADMDYRAPAISPWLVLYAELSEKQKLSDRAPSLAMPWRYAPRDPETVTRVRAVVIEELKRIDRTENCEIFKPWLTSGLRDVYAFKGLERLTDADDSCVQTDWSSLKAGQSQESVRLRARYIDLIQNATVSARDHVLSQLTGNGNDCFSGVKGGLPDWQKRLCNSWIHERETVELTLENSKLTLGKTRQFRRLESSAPNDAENKPMADQQAWFMSLAPGLPSQAVVHLGDYAKKLNREGRTIGRAILWRHPGHSRALLQLVFADRDRQTLWMLLTPRGLNPVNIPRRIMREHLIDSEIVRVSDLDQDGRLEVWWAPEQWGANKFDACSGEATDLNRHLDCSAIQEAVKMAEIDGDTLTYFVDDTRRRLKPPAGERWSSAGNAYPLPPAFTAQGTRTPACNQLLIGSVLSKKLAIEAWGEHPSGGKNVIDMTCARHPVNSEQTIVALFYEPIASDAVKNEFQVGFAVAVIDIRRKQVLRMYRSLIEEDATTRIRGNSNLLTLDTARYKLTPKVRALGVRMNTQYGPRYAEGGSNDDLTLFVEEGKALRPVLSDLTMRSWSMVNSSGCFDQQENSTAPCLINDEVRTLAVSSTSTNGWQDLELMTTTTQRDSNQPGQRGVARRLRYENGCYH